MWAAFDQLVRENTFDYYVTADMDGGGVAGTDSWGDYPTAIRADNEAVTALVGDGWDQTVAEYRRHLDAIAAFLDAHDSNALWEEGATHREYQLNFQAVGEPSGPSRFLYDRYRVVVRQEDRLDTLRAGDVLQQEPETELYVVPADFHY